MENEILVLLAVGNHGGVLCGVSQTKVKVGRGWHVKKQLCLQQKGGARCATHGPSVQVKTCEKPHDRTWASGLADLGIVIVISFMTQ